MGVPIIHPSAIVDPSAELADDVFVGPFCVVHPHAVIGSGTRLLSHVVIEKWTELGKNNEVHPGATLGGPPQDRKYKGERSFLRIGDDNILRECVTLHRASGEDAVTSMGNDNYIMAYSHFGHNCVIGSHVTVANGTGVSGHVRIEDYANIGGMVGVHQKVRIGKLAMVAAMSRVPKDIPPFMLVEGHPARVLDINAVGLKRNGVNAQTRLTLHRAAKRLFRSKSSLSKAIEQIEAESEPSAELTYLLDFMRELKFGRNGRGLERV